MDLGREIIMVLSAKYLTYLEFRGKGYHSYSSPCALHCFPFPIFYSMIHANCYKFLLLGSARLFRDDLVYKAVDSYLFCLAFV